MSFGIKSPPLNVLVIQGWRASMSWRNGYEGKNSHYLIWAPSVWFGLNNLILLTALHWTCIFAFPWNQFKHKQSVYKHRTQHHNVKYWHTFTPSFGNSSSGLHMMPSAHRLQLDREISTSNTATQWTAASQLWYLLNIKGCFLKLISQNAIHQMFLDFDQQYTFDSYTFLIV